jgi:hypothetical protein
METIKGFEYSKTRMNEDGEREYYIDAWDEWYTIDDLKETADEISYWENDYVREVERGNGEWIDDDDDDDDDNDDDDQGW